MTWKKKWMVATGLLALALGGLLTVSRGQAPGIGGAIELLPPTVHANYATQFSSGIVNPDAQGVDIPTQKRLLGLVFVATSPSGGTTASNLLDVYFQHSWDNGLSWQDFANVHVTNGQTGMFHIPISFVDGTSYPTTVPTNQDGTIANNTINPYVIGRRIRAKYKFGYGASSSGSWSFHVVVVPK